MDQAQLEAAYHMLKPFCLRRLKAEVEQSLPPRVCTQAQLSMCMQAL